MRALRLLPLLALLPLVAACDVTDQRAADVDVYTTEFAFRVSSAQLNSTGTVLSEQYDVPMLNRRVVDVGAVLCYFRENDTWTAMPYTYAVDRTDATAVDYAVSLGFAFEDRFLEVFYEASATGVVGNQPDRRIKLVLIGPDLANKQNVDYSDYEAVKRAYGLKD